MGSQPKLATRSKVVSIYNAPKVSGALPQIWGSKNHQILDHFSVNSALDTAYLRNETLHRQTKILVSVYNVSPKS